MSSIRKKSPLTRAVSLQPVRRTQAERREATRKIILDATVHVMAARGATGFRMEDVEEHAGVSRGALLHHFNTKDALILAAFEHVNERAQERSEQRTKFACRLRTIPEIVEAIFVDGMEFFFSEGFFVEFSLGFGQASPELRKAVGRMNRQSRSAVEAAWLGALKGRGLPDAIAEDVLNMTLNLVRGFMVRRSYDDNPQQRSHLFGVWQAMLSCYLDLILERSPRRTSDDVEEPRAPAKSERGKAGRASALSKPRAKPIAKKRGS